MVSAMDSGPNGPGSSAGQLIALCSWARHLALIVSFSTQVYKWVSANLLLGDPIQGGVEILLFASCYGNWNKLRPDGPLGWNVDFTK